MPTSINITDFNEMIASYIENQLKALYPTLDTAEGSPIRDLFLTPQQELLAPLVREVSAMELRSNLSGMTDLEESEVDEVGEGRYFLQRNTGAKATGTATFCFRSVSDTENLVIPQNLGISSAGGYKFRTSSRLELTPADLYLLYNTATGLYEVPVTVEAVDVGADYNIGAYNLLSVDTSFNSNFASIKNAGEFTGGIDRETNAQYISRIRRFYTSRQLGTRDGFEQFIYENFPEVRGVYVAGYKDPLMTRDEGKGGKVDVYIRSSELATATDTVIVHSPWLVLKNAALSQINEASVQVFTPGTPNISRTFRPLAESAIDSNSALVIVTSDLGLGVGEETIISVQYDFTGDDEATHSTTESFVVRNEAFPLQGPLGSMASTSIISIYDESKDWYLNVGGEGYQVSYDASFLGTSKENPTISFTNPLLTNAGGVYNGDTVTVQYTYNRVINEADAYYSIDENRIVTTDVLFLSPTPVLYNVCIRVKMMPGVSLTNTVSFSLRSSVMEYFDQLGLGVSVDEIDLGGILRANENIGDTINYIEFPLSSLYTVEDSSVVAAPGVRVSRTLGAVEYAALNSVLITEITEG